VRPWLDHYENTRDATAFMASLFGAFAGFGLVLCAVGLYGVLAYTVTRRMREFAVRVALGARRRDVIRLVVHDAAVTALAGVGIGAFIALWFTRPIIDGLDVVSVPYAPVIALVASESLLFVVSFVASLGPVRRAAQADPLEIIRAI
jgi:ABC-type antimicrobial peptide transport system permease subunit